jgi:hypothetical protein
LFKFNNHDDAKELQETEMAEAEVKQVAANKEAAEKLAKPAAACSGALATLKLTFLSAKSVH